MSSLACGYVLDRALLAREAEGCRGGRCALTPHMDWALMLHHFRAWAWWILPFVVIVYVTLDYLGFEKQRRQRVRAVEEMLRLGFGEVYQSDNTHTAAALLGDAAAQESVAESFGGDVDDITYGELDLPSIAKLLQVLESLDTISLPARPRLIDLGSGNGRAVLAMATMRPFALCEGVEISPALHSSALRHQSLFESTVRPRLPAERAKVVLRLRCADMLQADLTRADVVFVLSTAFSAGTMAQLFQHAESSMRRGAVLIVADQPTLSSRFACVSEFSYRSESGTRGDASWGKGTLRVLVRSRVGQYPRI